MGHCIYRPRLPDRSGMGDVATLRCSAAADTVLISSPKRRFRITTRTQMTRIQTAADLGVSRDAPVRAPYVSLQQRRGQGVALPRLSTPAQNWCHTN